MSLTYQVEGGVDFQCTFEDACKEVESAVEAGRVPSVGVVVAGSLEVYPIPRSRKEDHFACNLQAS